MLALMPYLASMPAVTLPLSLICGVRVRSEASFEMPYGFSSMFFAAAGGSMPTSVAATEARKMLVTPPVAAGTNVRCVHSFLRRIARRIWMPHSWPGPER